MEDMNIEVSCCLMASSSFIRLLLRAIHTKVVRVSAVWSGCHGNIHCRAYSSVGAIGVILQGRG